MFLSRSTSQSEGYKLLQQIQLPDTLRLHCLRSQAVVVPLTSFREYSTCCSGANSCTSRATLCYPRSWARSDSYWWVQMMSLRPYWKIQMTSEEVLLVLVSIKILRRVVCLVQGCLVWYVWGTIRLFRWQKAAFLIWLKISSFRCLGRRPHHYFSLSYVSICWQRAAGRGGPTPPL